MSAADSSPASSLNADPAGCFAVPAAGSWYYSAKSVIERGLGLVLLILALPLIGLLIIAIRLSSRGPGIYCQTRVGLGGRTFGMYKLRSMRVDAELRTGPVWAAAGNDPRVTPLGYWLRRLHLDELPQLYNVACGEMSLVGPRPERPSIAAVLAENIPGYLDRLRVMPGITGLAQINLPADTDLDSVRAKLVLDREYIEAASPLFDLRIILCTLLRVVGLRGGRAVALLGLKRVVVLPASATPHNIIPTASESAPGVADKEVTREPEVEPLVATEAVIVAGHG